MCRCAVSSPSQYSQYWALLGNTGKGVKGLIGIVETIKAQTTSTADTEAGRDICWDMRTVCRYSTVQYSTVQMNTVRLCASLVMSAHLFAYLDAVLRGEARRH